MALPNFFDKASLNALQILKEIDVQTFENILLKETVAICYDYHAISCSEGLSCLDMLVRLTARLYPNISFLCLDKKGQDYKSILIGIAKEINPAVETDNSNPSIAVVVGKTRFDANIPKYYVGADNWIVKFSQKKPQRSSDKNNPFSAGATACFGAANVFRQIFKNYLPHGEPDSEFEISILDFSRHKTGFQSELALKTIDLGEITLVGVGAIGNGTIWALKRLSNIQGKITCVDPEKLTLSNLQRYSAAVQSNIDQYKADLAVDYLKTTGLRAVPVCKSWTEYISNKKHNKISKVAVCVDSIEARIEVQASLPKTIFNAWTQQEEIGISRHPNFTKNPCVCCLYFPDGPKKSRSEEVADNLGLGRDERLVRNYIANNLPVDQNLISLIAQAKKIDIEKLIPFVGQNINIFYSEIICGGILLRFSEENNHSLAISVPTAFESALAGILLGSELVLDSIKSRSISFPSVTSINLMRPVSSYLNRNFPKHNSGRCICADEVFLKVYSDKWSSKE